MKAIINIQFQLIDLFQGNNQIRSYPISSAKNGVGQEINSLRTPLGKHIIRAKIGAGEPLNTIFKGRRLPARFIRLIWVLVSQGAIGF